MKSRAMRRAYARHLWDHLKVSLWFVPLVMTLAAFILSWLLITLDAYIPNAVLEDSRLVISGNANDLRLILIGISGTILATAGVVFSLLTLPLSTVASQFGSRLLRIFLRDRTMQSVLGIFVGTFSYCLATALAIPDYATQAETPQTTIVLHQVEAPQIATTFGLVLALASFASLILLIQHISTMLQAPNIIAAAGAELVEATRMDLFDEGQPAPEEYNAASLPESESYPLQVYSRGYIQMIDPQIILNLAKDKDLIIRLLRKPGQFIWPGETAALVWPSARVDAHLAGQLRRAIQIGNQRTPTQDTEYAVNQLVEIAVRAMSPAINDPFTTMTCLDYLANGLADYVRTSEASPNFYDKDGRLRLVFEPATTAGLLDAAFNMLRHASSSNASVLLHMLDAIAIIGQEAKTPQTYQELLRHASLIQAESQASNLVEQDKQRIRLHCAAVEAQLITAAAAGNPGLSKPEPAEARQPELVGALPKSNPVKEKT